MAQFSVGGKNLHQQNRIASLIALCDALLRKSVRGALMVTGELKVGETFELIHNRISWRKLLLKNYIPVVDSGIRKKLFERSDDLATELDIECCQDARDALL